MKLRNFAISIAQIVLINTKLFALESIRVFKGIYTPFIDIMQGKVKCLLLISRLKSIFAKLIAYFK